MRAIKRIDAHTAGAMGASANMSDVGTVVEEREWPCLRGRACERTCTRRTKVRERVLARSRPPPTAVVFNSLDARASYIHISLKLSDWSLRVEDNGACSPRGT